MFVKQISKICILFLQKTKKKPKRREKNKKLIKKENLVNKKKT